MSNVRSHQRPSRRLQVALRLAGDFRVVGGAVSSGGDVDALRLLEQRFRPGFQPIQIIRPSLHHLAPLGQMLCKVVSCAHRVALGVCELTFDDLMIPALFMQQC